MNNFGVILGMHISQMKSCGFSHRSSGFGPRGHACQKQCLLWASVQKWPQASH